MGWFHTSHPCKSGVKALVFKTILVHAAAIDQNLATVFFPAIILIPAHACMCSAVKLEKETSDKQKDYQKDAAHFPSFHTQDI